jgi:hypothetical protein
LKLLPAYTGAMTLEEAVHDARSARLLWLEILVNDRLDLSPWSDHVAVQEAYRKACRWYTCYRSLLQSLLSRNPLPHEPGPIDPREHRTFVEALRFVAAHD